MYKSPLYNTHCSFSNAFIHILLISKLHQSQGSVTLPPSFLSFFRCFSLHCLPPSIPCVRSSTTYLVDLQNAACFTGISSFMALALNELVQEDTHLHFSSQTLFGDTIRLTLSCNLTESYGIFRLALIPFVMTRGKCLPHLYYSPKRLIKLQLRFLIITYKSLEWHSKYSILDSSKA